MAGHEVVIGSRGFTQAMVLRGWDFLSARRGVQQQGQTAAAMREMFARLAKTKGLSS